MEVTTPFPMCGDNVTNTTNCTTQQQYAEYLDYTDTIAFERVIGIIVPIIFTLIVCIGLLGNALVIIVVVCNSQMRNTTNVLIISLAISDLSFIIICVPFTATDYALPYWPFGSAWCKIVQYMISVCAYASVYTLVLMSLDRFLAVVVPIASMSIRTTRNSWIAVGVLWGLILLANIPTLFIHIVVPYMFMEEFRSGCMMRFSEDMDDNTRQTRIYHICFFVFSYFIPLTLISGLYMFMLMRLWYGVVPGGSISSESLRSKKRVTRMVVVVVVVFALCWLPMQIIFIFQKVFGFQPEKPFVVMQIVSQCLAYMNSCMNPILYAFLSDNFRKGFRKVICCGGRAQHRTKRGYMTDYERTDCVGGRSAMTHTTAIAKNGKTENLINDHQV